MKRPRRVDAANTLAHYLREAMATHQLSGAALGKRAGIGHSHVSRIVSGELTPTLETLDRIAGALKVTVADMLAGAPVPEPEVIPSEDVADAKRVARLATAFAKCDERSQRLLLELAERLASKSKGEA